MTLSTSNTQSSMVMNFNIYIYFICTCIYNNKTLPLNCVFSIDGKILGQRDAPCLTKHLRNLCLLDQTAISWTNNYETINQN